MSTAPNKSSEPSMEEILASIRRIIADDSEGANAASAAPQKSAPAPVPDPDDVLDLAEAVKSSPLDDAVSEFDDIDFRDAESSAQPETVSADFDFDALEVPEEEPALPPSPVVLAPPQPKPLPADALVSPDVSAIVSSAFGSLSNTILSSNPRTLEDLVRDMLKPLLKSWLDENLPTLVERLVRAEIERVTRGGR